MNPAETPIIDAEWDQFVETGHTNHDSIFKKARQLERELIELKHERAMSLFHDPEEGLDAYREKLEKEMNHEMISVVTRLLVFDFDSEMRMRADSGDIQKAQVYLDSAPRSAVAMCSACFMAHEKLLERSDFWRSMGMIEVADNAQDKAIKFANIRDAIIAQWPADLGGPA